MIRDFYESNLFQLKSKLSRNRRNFCFFCGCVIIVNVKMSVVPQAAFAAKKIRMNEEKLEKNDLAATNYNSKYMNSIWGMYNRYSVHNLKKNMDDLVPNHKGQQKEFVGPVAADKSAADNVAGSLVAAKKFLQLPNFL